MFFRGSGFTVNQCAVSYVQEINRKIHPSHLLLPTFLIRRSSDILMSLQPCISAFAFACTTQYTQFPCHSSATKHTACMRANGYHNKDKLGHKNRFHLGDRIFFFCLRSFYWRSRFSTPEILLYFSQQHPFHT